jgi:hypothetical protein
MKEKSQSEIVPQLRILTVRDQRVLLDADLARLYGVETRVLNQAVKRNPDRFPEEFAFALTREEILSISQTVTSLVQLKFSKSVHAFTEHGALQAASVVNSPEAVLTTLTSLFFCVYLDGNPSGFHLELKLHPQRHSAT